MHYYTEQPKPEPAYCSIPSCGVLVTDKYMLNLQMEWKQKMESPAPYYCSLECLRRKFKTTDAEGFGDK